jgi:hypothetical protein
MSIVIFKDLATNEYINELKLEAEKYTGIYVDMNEPEQRKYVKEKAELINGLLKKVDRKRIDAAKEYKQAVEKEAASLVEDLKIANLPFTLLIDEYKAERKKILGTEKARKQAILDAEQYELDHEMALLINKTFEFDREQELKAQAEYENQLRINAEKAAKERQKQLAEAQERDRINAENARLANVEHVRSVNNAALSDLIELGLTENNAKVVVKAIAKKLISNITINY